MNEVNIWIFSTMFTVFLLLFILMQLVVLFHEKRKQRFRVFEKLGIPGPKPHWLVGNLLELKSTPLSKRLSELSAQFGSIWGFFEGPNPIIILSSPEMVRTFYLRESRNFQARKLLPININSGDPTSQSNEAKGPRNIFQSHGPIWQTIRHATEPAFTDCKLANYELALDKHLISLVDGVPTGVEFDIYPHLSRFGLNLNCEVFFGVALKESKSSLDSHPIHKGMINFFDDMERLAGAKGLWALAILFPELHFLLKPFCARLVNTPAMDYLRSQVGLIIRERLSNAPSTHRKDLLENLINSTDLRSRDTKKSPSKSLDKNDIAEQVQVFLYAGYETTATAVGYVLYCLARHTDIQEQLRAELMSIDEPVTGKALQQIALLEGVIKESLRLYPVVSSIALSRRCTASEAVTIDGMTIPPGMFVAPDVHAIHRNPMYWGPVDPNVFDPTRPQLFEKNSEAWLAFGIGPRRCLGQKFATATIRRSVYQLLMRFRIECNGEELNLTEGFNILPKSVPVRMTEL